MSNTDELENEIKHVHGLISMSHTNFVKGIDYCVRVLESLEDVSIENILKVLKERRNHVVTCAIETKEILDRVLNPSCEN